MPVEYTQHENILTNVLFQGIIMVLLFAAVWIFIMRRMSGGGGGGPGGQIFNIGKSKATLFDKEAQVSVTFNDVAGLEEAKQEVDDGFKAEELHEYKTAHQHLTQ